MTTTETVWPDTIGFEATYVRQETDRNGERPWEHNLWRVTLTFEGRTFSTDYRMGMGCMDYQPINHMRAVGKRQKGEDIRFNHFGPGQDALATPQTPTRNMVLSSLALDARCGDELFEDFADDMGYDRDSRKAYATWELCRQMHYDLRKFFGYGAFQRFQETDWEELECSSS